MVTIGLSMVCAVCLVALGDLRAAIPETIALMIIWGAAVFVLPRPRWGVEGVLWAALAIRLILVFSPLALSDDVYRYLWEGRVALAGGNPYLDPPGSAVWLAWGPDAIRAQVNHPEVPAIYPPLALWFFGLLGRIAYAPWIVKVAMAMADALVAWTLARILTRRNREVGPAWLYALIPLGAVESAASGHMEALAILCMVLAIDAWDHRSSGGGWAILGGCIKLIPFVLVPLMWRRKPWITALGMGIGLIAAAPFLDASLLTGMDVYLRNWSFNSGGFALLSWAFGSWARPVAAVIGVLVLVRALRVYRDPARIALWVGGAFVLLSPTVHPWYVLWAWVPSLLCGVRAWTLLAILTPLSYVALASYDPATSTWEEPWWPPIVTMVPFLVVLGWEFVRHATQPGPWAPGAIPKPPRYVSQTTPDVSTLFRP